MGNSEAHESSTDLHKDSAIRRQVAKPDDSTHRSFATDQDRFDIASVLVADQI
jgi:hypothetical protein